MFIERTASKVIARLIKKYRVVVISGPRQSGKTMLVQSLFSKWPYANLEELDVREFAEGDPRGFLAQYPDGAVLDEVQRVPGLLSYIQGVVDKDRRPGQYVLTGSQQFGLLAGITQSLAGRAAIVDLLPLAAGELNAGKILPDEMESILYKGLYPAVYDMDLEPYSYYGNYIRTYLERDVRQMVNVRDLGSFQRFMRLCAGRTGQLLNLSTLGSDAGVTHNTAKSWISVLEASYLIHLLPAHHQNFRKRIVKTPKLYFLDPGLVAWLLGIEKTEQIHSHAMRGAVFESFIVSELLKSRYNIGLRSNLYYWRSRAGLEIDVLLDRGERIDPLEIKSGKTIASDWFQSLRRWLNLAEASGGNPYLVYGGARGRKQQGVHVIPWHHIAEIG